MIAPAEAITIVDVRTEEDILAEVRTKKDLLMVRKPPSLVRIFI